MAVGPWWHTMTLADRLVWLLIVEYVVIALAYAWQRDEWRAFYFLSTAGISIAVLRMGR